MSAGPYREAPATEPVPVVLRPVPWKRYGLSTMAVAGIVAAADLICASALNIERAEPIGTEAIRWILVACVAVFAAGASVATCAELRGDR